MKHPSLKWSVWSADLGLIARTRCVEEAAAVVALQCAGSKIKHGRTVVWTEGPDHDGAAGESYDTVAEVAFERLGLKIG